MKRLLLIITLLSCSNFLQAQPFAIGNTTVTFTDPSRGNRAIETDIYYPAVSPGSNTAVAGINGEKYPVIVFGHGFVMTVSAYQNIWSALVPEGYIVALPKTEGGILPNHTNFGKDLAFVVTALRNSGSSSGNLFFNKVSAKSAVMGHSMGGGASFLAIQYNPAISTVVGLAPAETNPAASSAAQNITIPTLIFAGGNDCVTPAGQHSQLIYNSAGADCKSYINVIGGSHCQFANSNFNCSFGEATCSPGPTISRTAQQSLVTKYLLPYFDYLLKNNCTSWYSMQSLLSNDNAVSLIQNCNETTTCSAPGNRQARNITATAAKLTWKKGSCVNTHQVRYRKSTVLSWNIINSGKTNAYQLSNLQAGTTYDWQVKAKCDSSGNFVSGWGSLKQFTTSSLREEDGIELPDRELSFDLEIVPNPNSGIFRIEVIGNVNSNYNLEIVNILGTIIDRIDFNSDSELFTVPFDYTNQPAGIYFLRINDGKDLVTKRFIVQ